MLTGLIKVQFVLECEGLNERSPFCQPIRILRLHSCWEENAAFSFVIGGPAIILQRAE